MMSSFFDNCKLFSQFCSYPTVTYRTSIICPWFNYRYRWVL